MALFLDLETASECDLKVEGLRRYAEHLSTRVLCMAYCFDDDPMQFWWEDEGPFPEAVLEHFREGGVVWAHNAQFEIDLFEFCIANTHDFDPPPRRSWRCSMAAALASGHPAALDQLAPSLHMPIGKQPDGYRLIRTYCVPGHIPLTDPTDRGKMQRYCEDDVEVMRMAVQGLRPLSRGEWEEYHTTLEINDEGVPIDVDFCEAAKAAAEHFQADAAQQLIALTNGLVTKPTQRKARDEYLIGQRRLTEEQVALLQVKKKDGTTKQSLDATRRDILLDLDDLHPDAREFLEIVNSAGSSALKKFTTAADQSTGGLVHHTLLWHGAHSGRFSGKGLQPHNMRRDVLKPEDAESVRDTVVKGLADTLDGPSTQLARASRSMVTAGHGRQVSWCDWAAIEGRVSPWLTDLPQGLSKLELFQAGQDIYVSTASDISGVPAEDVDSDLRQVGKIAELSLGFGGHYRALQGMARNFGIVFADETAVEIVNAWRRSNEWALKGWRLFEKAARDAVKMPGMDFRAGRCVYHCDKNTIEGELGRVNTYLYCCLPDGKILSYPFPMLTDATDNYGQPYDQLTYQMGVRSAVGELRNRKELYGGLLFQNAVQGVAARLLIRATETAMDAGLDVRLHVHDEILIVGGEREAAELQTIMLDVPPWAEGLPLATGDPMTATRWGK